MADDPDPIPNNLREAFADALSAYSTWSPGHPSREVSLDRQFYSIETICGFVDKFTDMMPEHLIVPLLGFMRGFQYDQQRSELNASPTYATAARSLRMLIQDRERRAGLR